MSACSHVYNSQMKPLCIDLFCGLGGWAEGFLSEGWDVIGFDIERHRYPKVCRTATAVKLNGNSVGNGAKVWSERPIARLKDALDRAQIVDDQWDEYPAQLVLQDVLTLHGAQFRNARCIVASPPCQAYSYRAMPWKRARELPPPSNELFDMCFELQRQACVAAGRYIPLVVENVCGAQRWVGRARWHYGSYYMWGDVPALMPSTFHSIKVPSDSGRRTDPGNGTQFTSRDCGVKTKGFANRFEDTPFAWYSSRSNARKAASAQIAKIPFELSSYIARVFKS